MPPPRGTSMKKSLLFALLLFVPSSAARAEGSFAGTWDTTFGPMTLTQEGKKVQGHYDMEGNRCPIRGTVEKNRLTFTYEEPDARGEGWFELSAAGNQFSGKWRANGQSAWAEWKGQRVEPVAGRVWLVVLEANWENDLSEQEYTFGAMLRAFFARSAKVQVRHRFFTDAASLVKWSKEVAYL